MDVQNYLRKYSKISPPLKYFFLECLYFRNLTIKEVHPPFIQAASRFKLNYSTAKVIIRDLSHKEKNFVKRLLKRKENEEKKYKTQNQQVCQYKLVDSADKGAKDHSET